MRKLLGGLIVVLLAIPLLSGMVFAVGLLRGLFGEQFLGGIPQAVVERLPRMADDLFAAASEPGAVKDEKAKAWMAAARDAGLKPSELLDRLGIYPWLDKELTGTLDNIGRALAGEIAPDQVKLDLRPLKQSLQSDATRTFIQSMLSKLPACNDWEANQWLQAGAEPREARRLPPCNPGIVTPQGVDLVLARVNEIPDEVPVMRDSHIPPRFNLARAMAGLAWLLFLVPAVFVLLGSAIGGAGSWRSFWRWCGFTTLLGALGSLVISLSVRAIATAAATFDPVAWFDLSRSPFWTSESARVLATHMTGLADLVVDRLFAPVTQVSLIVLAAGALFLVVSFACQPKLPAPPQA